MKKNLEKSKKKGSVIRRIILIICIIVFCVSAGMLIKILLEYKKGSDIYKDVQSEVLDDNTPVTVEMPEGEVEIPFKYNHEALLAILTPKGIFMCPLLIYVCRLSREQIMKSILKPQLTVPLIKTAVLSSTIV